MSDIRKSLSLIQEFLQSNNIIIDPLSYLQDILIEDETDDYSSFPTNIIPRIIGDSYGYANEIVKKIANLLQEEFGIFIGRIQKLQLKKYIDYGEEGAFDLFLQLINGTLQRKEELKDRVNKIIKKDEPNLSKFIEKFVKNMNTAIKEEYSSRIQDYLIFLYSKLTTMNENNQLSLVNLFEQNEKYLKKELDEADYRELGEFCSDITERRRSETIRQFNEKYIQILERNEDYENKNAVIYLNIDQDLLESFNSKEKFYGYLFEVIKKSYDSIQNHKTLLIRIRNILHNDINIKWELYAYLTIFAEKFLQVEYNKTFYKPEEICADVLEYRFDIKLSVEKKKLLGKYYKNSLEYSELEAMKGFQNEKVRKIVEYFRTSPAGFVFIDCFVLKTDEAYPNSKEINFISNTNDLLLVFLRHDIDKRKIPCPVCGSLKISGNSYPEIGVKSWECKNPFCSARSKTNRGKRYSKRTILMQDSLYDFTEEIQIPNDLVALWRKDYVEKWDLQALYRMILKFFSYTNDKLMVINAENPGLITSIGETQKRLIQTRNFEDFLDYKSISTNLFHDFMETNPFFDQFLYKRAKKLVKFDKDIATLYANDETVKIIHSDCLPLLQQLPDNSVHNMVTSPPYYNAREYSQWQNLFNYLNEMYNVIVATHRVLCEGGVFFYNIGDIFDNEKIVVQSKMGEKRIPLGAYIILLFEKAGFTLLDNIIWYKGEPQSNRHKNDGNFTPYYQRPTNCYEHIFIFKKTGKLRLNSDRSANILDSNIQKFSPVIKIGKGGINKYGHSAPFPPILPEISILCFTDPNDVVLDPFSGSGMTPIVAVENDRIGIGLELNETYTDLSIQLAKEKKLSTILFYKDGFGWRTSLYEVKGQTSLFQFLAK